MDLSIRSDRVEDQRGDAGRQIDLAARDQVEILHHDRGQRVAAHPAQAVRLAVLDEMLLRMLASGARPPPPWTCPTIFE